MQLFTVLCQIVLWAGVAEVQRADSINPDNVDTLPLPMETEEPAGDQGEHKDIEDEGEEEKPMEVDVHVEPNSAQLEVMEVPSGQKTEKPEEPHEVQEGEAEKPEEPHEVQEGQPEKPEEPHAEESKMEKVDHVAGQGAIDQAFLHDSQMPDDRDDDESYQTPDEAGSDPTTSTATGGASGGSGNASGEAAAEAKEEIWEDRHCSDGEDADGTKKGTFKDRKPLRATAPLHNDKVVDKCMLLMRELLKTRNIPCSEEDLLEASRSSIVAFFSSSIGS